ncbi:MAG: peptidase M4 family protein [Nocardioides sp.]|nr:peptidase M4 family protein [Nocardioides sp.]
MRKPSGLALAAVSLAAVAAMPLTSSSPASAAPADDPGAAARDAVAALVAHPGVGRQSTAGDLAVTDTVRDADGSTHVRMERTYRGLPVVGGDLVVHQDADSALEGVSQTLAGPLSLGTKPSVRAAAAGRSAVAPARDLRGLSDLALAEGATPDLVVDAYGATPRLAWAVLSTGVQADGTPSRLTTYVDARTGEVLRRVEGIHTVDGEGQSLYNGTVPLTIDTTSGGYTLTDVERGGAATTDMQNKTDSFACQLLGMRCTNGVAFVSSDTSFGDGTTGNRETAAVDAHYGGAETYDYFSEVHGRAGIFGDGTGAPSRVHYGSDYVNAFWDGEKMTYGDGDGNRYGPLVSLDVAGHEMSHGVTENTANLTYSGESGGLNEATSDIFGTMVEFFSGTAANPADYLIGEQFDATGQGLRRMDDPASDGSSQSCYDSSTGNLDVHYSSGVGNHFFYLLAEGSGAKTINGVAHDSPTCDGSTVTGIGRDAAQQIWFRALTVYFTSGTDYAGARQGTISAAEDLYGAGSTQAATVAAAWDAVNVG